MIYIVIPTYNRAHTIIRAIQSIIFQENIYLIIVDDGSTDNTKLLLDKYIEYFPIMKNKYSYSYKQNGGVCDAINTGVNIALEISEDPKNDFILFLGSDDELDKDNFRFVFDDLIEFPQNNCFIFPMRNSDNSRVSVFKSQDKVLTYGEFLDGKYIEGSDKVDNLYVLRLSLFIDKSIRFPSMIPGGEWLLFHKIIKHHSVVLINRSVYIVHVSSNSMTRRLLDLEFYKNQYNLQKREIEEFGEDLRKFNIKSFGYHCLIYARYCFILKKYKEGYVFFKKGINITPLDIYRILLCFIALLPFSIEIINLIIRILGYKIEITKVKLNDLKALFNIKPNGKNIPISHPIIEQDEIDAVVRVMKTGNIVQGHEVIELEKSFTELTGATYAIAVNSGTAAIHAGLYALGIKEEDEVITSPFTFVASANPILMQNAKVVFADINEDDYLIDIREVEKKITTKTKAVIPISLYGQVYDYDALKVLADKHNFSILEDACQSVGANYKGLSSGACGDIGTFSLYATKNIMCGEGGMLVTSNKEFADRARAFRQHGMEVSGSYMYKDVGYNYRLPDLLAAIGNVQFKKLDIFTQKRIQNATQLTEMLSGIPGIRLPKINPGNHHVFHQYTICITEEFPLIREDLIARLAHDGIGTKIYYPIPIHLYSHFSKFGYKEGDFPIAERVAKGAFSLPIHPSVTKDDLEYIANRIKFYSQL